MIGYPLPPPITASIPQCGHTAVPSFLSSIQCVMAEGWKMRSQWKQPQRPSFNNRARWLLLCLCAALVLRLAGSPWYQSR